MLVIENICKSFGKIKAVDNISLRLKKNETIIMLGENGAGKSTLFRLISGYLEADSGSIQADDTDIQSDRVSYLNKIGYVPEISALYGEMTTVEFLLFATDLKTASAETTTKKLHEAILNLELEEVKFQRLDTLSKGFKKRVELAAALIGEPEILLLDEPTEGLDPLQKESIRKIIKNYAKKHLVIISTHALEDVESMSQRVLLVHKGKITADIKTADLKKSASANLLTSFKKMTGE